MFFGLSVSFRGFGLCLEDHGTEYPGLSKGSIRFLEGFLSGFLQGFYQVPLTVLSGFLEGF